jgi:hypothetical protein
VQPFLKIVPLLLRVEMNKSRLSKVIFNLIICISFIIVYFLIISIIRNRLDVPQKYALLVGGGVTERDDNESFYSNIEYVSNVLKRLKYKNENVKILFYGGDSKIRSIAVAEPPRVFRRLGFLSQATMA